MHNRLKVLRERSRLTQDEVSRILDMDTTTISRHESGSRNLTPSVIKKYAELYKTESYEIFLDPSDMDPGNDV